MNHNHKRVILYTEFYLFVLFRNRIIYFFECTSHTLMKSKLEIVQENEIILLNLRSPQVYNIYSNPSKFDFKLLNKIIYIYIYVLFFQNVQRNTFSSVYTVSRTANKNCIRDVNGICIVILT